MDNSIRIPLNLPDVQVLELSKTERGDWLIKIESTLQGTTCHKCGHEITDLHCHDQALRIRHLPLFEVPVYLEIRPKRYRCGYCDDHPTTTQRLEWHEPRSPNTKAYEHWLLRILINSTVSDVARKLGVSEDVVSGTIDRWIACQVDWSEYLDLQVIGIDEISLKRGHRDFVVLITIPTTGGVDILAVLADRKQQTVANFLQSIPLHLRQTIERVCTDMYQGFVSAVREQLPQTKVVIDRFHVAKAYRNCADTVRKREVKRLRQELPKQDYDSIKGAMWAFRKRPENLQESEQQLLERVFAYSPEMKQAYKLREELTQIFEGRYTKNGAKCAIRAWCKRVLKSDIKDFESFLTTVNNWMDEMTNYFLEGWTSGFVEGFNNRVKVLKRRCYGIFDIERLFQRISLDLNGYQTFALT
ncbi:ISL3 family transposase [Acaryochloris marina]|uniref:ISL3 family transposase n=1 Tax=Acaryochloris marina TaxID=155978 RepID=UPI001BB02690|nr:ISL3 family transposase [Acaryochloris marina]QUY42087.1 ISL3 family transposase [Acaryochloris marina S15]QUY42762.1 ISL3 family transposase [Acaryochloris marina S15]QUY44253.1 ISL3 family transposase [Acaryochloris marina S15]